MIRARHDKARRILIITADNESRRDLADAYRDTSRHGGYSKAEGVVSEGLHEEYDFCDPADVPGALTDAPILIESDAVLRPDNGEVILLDAAPVFWFANYMIRDPWRELANRGRVEFQEAESDPDYVSPPAVPADIADYMPGGARCGEAFYLGAPDGLTPEGDLPEPLRSLMSDLTYNRDLVDPGCYFVKAGRLMGPYNTAANGQIHLEQAGALAPAPRAPEPPQPELFAA